MLSAVYIKGFKTFAHPVRMPLEDGVTAIVGPNGSGKSNITDAVLFALGEQSPGLLRAGSMSELIFSGSDSLKATNVAEVTLVMDNSTGRISLPYEEVSLTRRIVRDGGTEYRINGTRARLADVRSVAGEAGLGRHSILRQGAVDAIVAGGAEACRNAVEEAAGLGVYRRRRLSASRRLEKADAQLEQSRNIEAELAGQLQRIEREAVAARQYREVEGEYRKVSLAYLYGIASRGMEDVTARISAAENDVQEIEARRRGLATEQAELQERLAASEKRLHASERLVENLESSLERVRSGSFKAERNVLRLEAVSDTAGRQRAISRLESEVSNVRERLGELRERYAEVERDHSRKRAERDELENAASDVRKRLSEAERERSRAASRLEGLTARRDAMHDTTGRDPVSEDRLAAIGAGVRSVEEVSVGAERISRNTSSETSRKVSDLEGGLNRRRGRLSLISGRVESRVRDLGSDSGRGDGVRLFEVVRARPGYEFAVEAALGEFGGGLFTDDVNSGVKLLSDEERVAIRMDARNVEEDGDEPGGVPLLECVEILDERYSDAVEGLLGGVFVVEDAAARQLTNGYVAVTRDGIRLTRTSISLARAGRFARETRLAQALDLLESLRSGPEAHLEEVRVRLDGFSTLSRELREMRRRTSRLSERLARARESLLREARRRHETLARARERAKEREDRRGEIEAELSSVTETLHELSRQAADVRRERVEASTARDRAFSEFDEMDRLRRSLLTSISESARRIDDLSKKLDRIGREPSDDRSRLPGIAARTSAVAESLAGIVGERRAEIRLRRAEQTEHHRHHASQQNDLMRREANVGIELATAKGLVERLEESRRNIRDSASGAEAEIREEWSSSLEDARREAESCEVSPENLERERTRLARRLKRFGDINLLALSQEEEIRGRYETISSQRADAEEAAAELDRIIHSIDSEIETRFSETFSSVKGRFARMVPRMLAGASGSLELTEDGVEVGLRLGRKGWRSLKVLSGGERSLLALSFLFSILLSRTEGSGTFCILDEAEAALDDINLARFIAVIDSHRREGQFLLVTHQKRTMAAADVLYGVVQDASGATAVVSKRIQGD